MIKILHSADWHINLHKKKVPYEWQANRFRLFFEEIHRLEKDCDVHILAGDVFDRKPEADEVCLFLRFANSVTIPTYIIPGNHEATRKGKTFLEHFHEHFTNLRFSITDLLYWLYINNCFNEFVVFLFSPYSFFNLSLQNPLVLGTVVFSIGNSNSNWFHGVGQLNRSVTFHVIYEHTAKGRGYQHFTFSEKAVSRIFNASQFPPFFHAKTYKMLQKSWTLSTYRLNLTHLFSNQTHRTTRVKF